MADRPRVEARARRRSSPAGGVLFLVAYRQVLEHRAEAELAAAARRDHVRRCAGSNRRVRGRAPGRAIADVGLDYAWSTAATIEPHVEGREFFPRIFADVRAASSSVHILMFGWREGTVGTDMADLLVQKLGQGVEVRIIVDGYGSRPFAEAKPMFTRLAQAGAQIVVNDIFPRGRGRPVARPAADRLAPGRDRPSRPRQAHGHARPPTSRCCSPAYQEIGS